MHDDVLERYAGGGATQDVNGVAAMGCPWASLSLVYELNRGGQARLFRTELPRDALLE